jgi:L-asparaginase II
MTHPAHGAVTLAEVWRGPFLESAHLGHAVVCDETGQIVQSWGVPDAIVLPRSSSKILQALPLIESGAAAAYCLTTQQLALACASHIASTIHTDAVSKWLDHIGCAQSDLCCGPQVARDADVRDAMTRAHESPCPIHNNCSGKHAGFLTLTKHLKAGPDYIALDHPVQMACLDAFERMTQETSPGHGIDGCSAPNFACTLHGMARAMAKYAAAPADSPQGQLRNAMALHPELIAGEGAACTRQMRAAGHGTVVKTGAEGYYIGILPEQKLGVALKITDGGTRASECAMAQILVNLGALDPNHPDALAYTNSPIKNWDGLETGYLRAAPTLL